MIPSSLQTFLAEIAELDWRLVALCILVVLAFVILDAALLSARKTKQSIGLSEEKEAVSIDGVKTLPIKNYVSLMQGLAGKPDAVISENGFIIPVERKPLAKKIRDRYIAQLLVYMRLVEEFEGKRPPYGYLILGPKCKTFKIDNTEGRQKWLDGMLVEMKAHLGTGTGSDMGNGTPVTATPDKRKCDKCFVRVDCQWKVE